MMIVEDDVIFTQDLVTLLPKIEDFVTSHLQGKAAVLHLQRQDQYIAKAASLTDTVHLYKTQHAISAIGYIITREAASHILKIQTPLRWEIDFWKFYYYLGAVKLFATNIDLVKTSQEFPSVITAMGKRIHTRKNESRLKRRFLSCLLSSPRKYRQLAFYIGCKCRKVYSRAYEPLFVPKKSS